MNRLSNRVVVGITGLIFLLALVSASPVEAITPLRWDASLYYTFEPEWSGDIWRDDGTHGTVYIDIVEWRDLPNVQHFSGVWCIAWDDGGIIEGDHAGKVVWSSGDVVLNGEVTETSDVWSDLYGRQLHVMGNIDLTVWTATAMFQFN